METYKSLYDISWQVTEPQYRQDKALSYSTLAKYEREGFNNLSHLFDRVETPSLIFGSAVDSIITGGEKEFKDRFMVADFPSVSDSVLKVTKALYHNFSEIYSTINDIPFTNIADTCNEVGFYNNWRDKTRVDKVISEGSEYYQLMYLAGDKTIIDSETYQKVRAAVSALRESKATEWYFAPNDPFDNSVERFYQLKFKATFNNVDYRCMMDLAIVLHKEKRIIPCDLKTSSHNEWDFYISMKDWRYDIQNRLYYRILRDNIDRDKYFKDFELMDYRDIVINKNTLTPLVWECPFTKSTGDLTFGRNKQIVFRDPFTIGEELDYYFKYSPRVPKGININVPNNVEKWLNKL